MVGTIGAQVASLAFATAILAGMLAGNTPVTILSRALFVLIGALLVGQLVGWSTRAIMRDYLRQRKLSIEREQADDPDATDAAPPEQAHTPAKTG